MFLQLSVERLRKLKPEIQTLKKIQNADTTFENYFFQNNYYEKSNYAISRSSGNIVLLES